METVELIARLGLAIVFAVAGLAKLADRPGSEQALSAFGMPRLLARPGSVLLPLAELAVAVLLIPAGTATLGALGALVLLLGFSAGIMRSMARGQSPDCHCLGELHSKPVGWPMLARNATLVAASGLVLVAALPVP